MVSAISQNIISYQTKELTELQKAIEINGANGMMVTDMEEVLRQGRCLGMPMQARLFLYRQKLGLTIVPEGPVSRGPYKG